MARQGYKREMYEKKRRGGDGGGRSERGGLSGECTGRVVDGDEE